MRSAERAAGHQTVMWPVPGNKVRLNAFDTDGKLRLNPAATASYLRGSLHDALNLAGGVVTDKCDGVLVCGVEGHKLGHCVGAALAPQRVPAGKQRATLCW